MATFRHLGNNLVFPFLGQIFSFYNWCDWKTMKFLRVNERPTEYAYLLSALRDAGPTTVLDVGPGKSALPAVLRGCGYMVTAVDNDHFDWVWPTLNRHYHVISDDITKTRLTGRYDFVSCISVIEHIPEHVKAFRNMYELLRPGGTIVVTCPYTEDLYVEDTWFKSNKFITQSFSRREIDEWIAQTGAVLKHQEYWQYFTGQHWWDGERFKVPIKSSKDKLHQLTCMTFYKNE